MMTLEGIQTNFPNNNTRRTPYSRLTVAIIEAEGLQTYCPNDNIKRNAANWSIDGKTERLKTNISFDDTRRTPV